MTLLLSGVRLLVALPSERICLIRVLDGRPLPIATSSRRTGFSGNGNGQARACVTKSCVVRWYAVIGIAALRSVCKKARPDRFL